MRPNLFMTETTFWQSLRKKLVPRIYALKINISYVAGVPDVWLSGSKGDLWLELKYLQTVPPVVNPTKLLSILQQQWLKRRHAEGRSVGVLIGSVDGHLYFPSCSWDSPVTREAFQMRAKKTKEIAEELIEFVGEIDPSLWAGLVE
jgi:hypothetical protein